MEIGNTFICSIKDDKKAIITFTFDDALYKPAIFFSSELSKRGLKGTFAITTNFVRDSNGNDVNGTWEQWINLINASKFDVANHSKSHLDLTKLTPEELEEEINHARKILISKFKGQKVLCMVNPFNATNDVVDKKISEFHYAARNGIEGYNSISPPDKEWLRLNYKGIYHDTSATEMKKWIDESIKNNLWLIEMIHGVNGIGWEAAPDNVFRDHFDYVSSKKEEIWNATFEEATMYIREVQSTSINLKIEDRKVNVKLKNNLQPYFDYPLTLKTIVPNEDIKLTSNGRYIPFNIKREENRIFVYYEAIPKRDDISILF
ncbi:polysaccharide deacetylase family protein [Athalassotoga saccharophila]|uniref:polysaccharide deacetylase family protein n=1 Tax=Athalassotoga saccharophila TaxID=1441386 RepID=UPI00137A4D03|nr:polysaccharide deacetylase family protein [Athalassotoga saccharophila]BBJ27292.1 gellan lyase [Athalassotoga saccharophila]